MYWVITAIPKSSKLLIFIYNEFMIHLFYDFNSSH